MFFSTTLFYHKEQFMQKTKIALFICSVFVIPSFAVYAQESSETSEADTLEIIVVSETSFSQQIGTQKIKIGRASCRERV